MTSDAEITAILDKAARPALPPVDDRPRTALDDALDSAFVEPLPPWTTPLYRIDNDLLTIDELTRAAALKLRYACLLAHESAHDWLAFVGFLARRCRPQVSRTVN